MSEHTKSGSLTGNQVREARDLLNLSGADLGRLCKLPRFIIYKFESTGHLPQPMFRRTERSIDRMAAIRHALEGAGIEFTEGNAPGVKLRADKLPSTVRSEMPVSIIVPPTTFAPVSDDLTINPSAEQTENGKLTCPGLPRLGQQECEGRMIDQAEEAANLACRENNTRGHRILRIDAAAKSSPA